MIFSSITFLGFFLPCVLLFYFIIPNLKYRNTVLLVFSLLFYAWGEPKFVFLMSASIVLNYVMGLLIASKNKKKILLFIAIVLNLGILFIFKYLGFTGKIINTIIESLHLRPLSIINLVLPIGISFYTFQEISYLVDVYRNPELVQKNILNLGLYITFFPQLIAGPIVRYHDINKQIEERHESVEMFSQGLERFIIGLSKKVLLANNFALVCDTVFGSPFQEYGVLTTWIAAFAYTMQIYYDFSGYSDMAIGIAKLFGFELLENFNYPYAASSVTDFWKRWHISLTNFFRDYVYIPLGGNRKGSKRTILNRFIIFFLTGLWHGASYNFVCWGLFHGAAMTLERKFKINKAKNKLMQIFVRIFSLFIIMFLWILFRNTASLTLKIWLKMFGINYSRFTSHFLPNTPKTLVFFYIDFKFLFVSIAGILFSFPWWRKVSFFYKNSIILTVTKKVILILLLGMCFAYLANNTYNPFIYFRF